MNFKNLLATVLLGAACSANASSAEEVSTTVVHPHSNTSVSKIIVVDSDGNQKEVKLPNEGNERRVSNKHAQVTGKIIVIGPDGKQHVVNLAPHTKKGKADFTIKNIDGKMIFVGPDGKVHEMNVVPPHVNKKFQGNVLVEGKANQKGRPPFVLVDPRQVDKKIIWIDGGDAKPKAEGEPASPKQPKKANVAPKEVAYLGVSMAPVPEQVRSFLELPEGRGVLIQMVQPKSAADVAGIKKNDIILNADKQAVNNIEELRNIIQNSKPGQEIALGINRKGKDMVVTAKLGKRALAEVNQLPPIHRIPFKVDPNAKDDLQFEVLPIEPEQMKNLPPQVQKMLKEHFKRNQDLFGQFDKLPDGNAPDFEKHMMRQLEQMRRIQADLQRQMKEMQQRDFKPNPNAKTNISQVISQSDGEHRLTIKVENGHKHLTVKDNDGKVLFDGPVNTDEERQAIPNDLLKKFKKLDSSTKLNFKFFQSPEKPDKEGSKKRIKL